MGERAIDWNQSQCSLSSLNRDLDVDVHGRASNGDEAIWVNCGQPLSTYRIVRNILTETVVAAADGLARADVESH